MILHTGCLVLQDAAIFCSMWRVRSREAQRLQQGAVRRDRTQTEEGEKSGQGKNICGSASALT